MIFIIYSALYPEHVIASRTHRSWFWTHKIRASASIWMHRSCFWTQNRSIGIQLVDFENWFQINFGEWNPSECIQIDFENVFKCKSDARAAEETRFRHHWLVQHIISVRTMMDVAIVACVAGSLHGVATKGQGGKWGDNLSPPPPPTPLPFVVFSLFLSYSVYLDLRNFKGFNNVGS